MSRWKVEVIPKAEKEIKSFAADVKAHFIHVVDMLEEMGPQRVGEPHVKHLGNKLWEMRLKGRDGIARAIYFAATDKRLVVVRAFVKKTQKTPKHEIDLAAQRMKGL